MTVSPAVLHRLGGEGPPVLLVHGFGADRFGWGANAHALMGSHTTWVVDLPGHGGAGNDVGDGTPAALSRGLAAALADLPRPLPVVAHSLGAAVVLHLAQAEPATFDRLVLLAPAGLGQGIDTDFLARFPSLVDQDAAKDLLGRLVTRPQFVPPMADHVLSGLDDPDRRAALAAIASMLPMADPPPAPDDVDVTVLWGAEDRVIPPPDGPVLGISPEIVPRAGHLLHVEAAGAVNRRLATLLA